MSDAFLDGTVKSRCGTHSLCHCRRLLGVVPTKPGGITATTQLEDQLYGEVKAEFTNLLIAFVCKFGCGALTMDMQA